GGTGGGAGYGGGDPRGDAGSRQELRHAGLRARNPRGASHPAPGAEQYLPPQRHRSTHHPTPRLRPLTNASVSGCKVLHRGRERVAWMFTWTAAIYNLVRMGNLLGARA